MRFLILTIFIVLSIYTYFTYRRSIKYRRKIVRDRYCNKRNYRWDMKKNVKR